MCQFYIILIHHSIPKCCINLLMPKNLLNLFYWHSLFYRSSCHSSSKLMWMYFFYSKPFSHFSES